MNSKWKLNAVLAIFSKYPTIRSFIVFRVNNVVKTKKTSKELWLCKKKILGMRMLEYFRNKYLTRRENRWYVKCQYDNPIYLRSNREVVVVVVGYGVIIRPLLHTQWWILLKLIMMMIYLKLLKFRSMKEQQFWQNNSKQVILSTNLIKFT